MFSFIFFSTILIVLYYIHFNNKLRANITLLCHRNNHYTNYFTPPSYLDTVIFTMLVNIPFSVSKYFFLSLIKVKYKGLIVVLTNNMTEKFSNMKLNIHFIEITDYYPFYPIKHHTYSIPYTFINNTVPYFITSLPIFYIRNVVRYFIFYMWLEYYGSKFKYYIFSDLRDVIFQKHPFGWNLCKGVILTEESNLTSLLTISPQFNIQYFKNRSIMNHTVLNGGLLYGSYKELTYFLQVYTNLYKKFGFAGNDQSILNYIYYVVTPKKFNFSVIVQKEGTGYSRCLGSFLDMTNIIPFDKTGLIINKDKTYPSVIHQYSLGLKKGSVKRKMMFKAYIYNLIKL